MPRKRKRRTRSEMMASIELISEASRFCNDFQYLWGRQEGMAAAADRGRLLLFGQMG